MQIQENLVGDNSICVIQIKNESLPFNFDDFYERKTISKQLWDSTENILTLKLRCTKMFVKLSPVFNTPSNAIHVGGHNYYEGHLKTLRTPFEISQGQQKL